jgi:hypothetical protein
MKHNKKIRRPIQALFASILMLSSIQFERFGQITASLILIFFGSYIFGNILQSIKIERQKDISKSTT